MPKTAITEAEILAARTPKGAWTAKQLAEWGVPWPPPGGWKAQIIAHGIPFDADMPAPSVLSIERPTQAMLDRMMEASSPELIDGDAFEVVGELNVDPAQLLRKVVSAVIGAGHADILWEFPEVLAFFGSRIPQRDELAGHHNVDTRMFDAAEKWPNRKPA